MKLFKFAQAIGQLNTFLTAVETDVSTQCLRAPIQSKVNLTPAQQLSPGQMFMR